MPGCGDRLAVWVVAQITFHLGGQVIRITEQRHFDFFGKGRADLRRVFMQQKATRAGDLPRTGGRSIAASHARPRLAQKSQVEFRTRIDRGQFIPISPAPLPARAHLCPRLTPGRTPDLQVDFRQALPQARESFLLFRRPMADE